MRPSTGYGAHEAIFVAGARGMTGSAIVRALRSAGLDAILTPTRAEVDLTSQAEVMAYFRDHAISQVYLAAAKVGGIHANSTRPADFLFENLMIEANVIHAAHCAGVNRLLFVGSSCIYPRLAPQPTREEAMLTGPLDPSNASYGLAKIAGIKLCEAYRRQHKRDYRALMPGNIYGPHDNFALEASHVVPALMRRFHEAVRAGESEVVVWGSGSPQREFLHVDDVAKACLHVMGLEEAAYWYSRPPEPPHLNAGTGAEYSIRTLAGMIAGITGFAGNIVFDASKPDGTARKLVDASRLAAFGWQPAIDLDQGLRSTYRWFVNNQHLYRGAA